LVTAVTGTTVSGKLDGPAGSYDWRPVRLVLFGTEDLANGGEVATGMTDGRGEFTFGNVPAGMYVVDAGAHPSEFQLNNVVPSRGLPDPPGIPASALRAVGSAVSIADVMLQSQPRGSPFEGHINLTVDDDEIANLVVSMRKSGSLSGRFVWEGPGNATPDGQGALQAMGANAESSLGCPVSQTDSASPDQFRIDGLVGGEYVFALSPIVVASGRAIKSIQCEGVDHTYVPLQITSGTDVTGCLVTISSAIPVLSGVVTTAQARSPVEATVIVFPVEREMWRSYGLRPARLKGLQVRSDGAFQFRTLPAGEYFVIALSSGLANAWQDPAFLQRAAGLASRVRLDWGMTVTKNLDIQSIAVVK
jgi:hypothetical protein